MQSTTTPGYNLSTPEDATRMHISYGHRIMSEKPNYEYIVVGSGAGGAPLACNLARHGRSVLVLEAGDDQGHNLNTQIPAFHTTSSEDPAVRWDFFVRHFDDEVQAARDPKMTWNTPEGFVYVGANPPPGSNQKGILYPRAGTLGGCTMHHAMMTFLPPDEDWQHIADITGDRSWEAQNMKKYFERVERCRYLPEGAKGHGFDGWLESSHADPGMIESQKPFIDAALDTAPSEVNGIPAKIIHDSNDPDSHSKEGVCQIILSVTKTGRRSSPRDYLVETASATNPDGSKKYPLHIRANCFTTKILFSGDSQTPRAIGVEFLEGTGLYEAAATYNPNRQAKEDRAFASREVIICGGAFNTPQLLKLSGIGPREELESFDIPIVADIPGVGTNLQDNYETHVLSRSPKDISILAHSLLGAAGDPFLKQWVTEGSGPFKSNGEAVGIKKQLEQRGTGSYSLFLFGGPISFAGFFPGYSRAGATFNKFCWNVLRVHPRNERAGTVSLRSGDPRHAPDVNFRFFNDNTDADHDLGAMAEGVAVAREMFSKVANTVGKQVEESPGPGIQGEAVKQDIKDKAFSHHATSTCAIGSADDPLACLDSKFRVRGVDGLRVVDASIFSCTRGISCAANFHG